MKLDTETKGAWVENRLALLLIILVSWTVWGCDDDPADPGDGDADADVDGDSDADSDGDVDGDADGDGDSDDDGETPSFGNVDTHIHFAAASGGPEGHDWEGAANVAVGVMDRLGIELSIVMPPPFTTGQPGLYTFEAFLDGIAVHQDRFAFLGGGGSLNAMIQDAIEHGETTEEMRTTFETRAHEIMEAGALGFGEFAVEHFSLNPGSHPYERAPADHELFLLLADIAAEYGAPIDIHMEAIPEAMDRPEDLSPPNPGRLQPNIDGLVRLLEHNEDTVIVWVHAGWCNTGRRTTELMNEFLATHSNLYMSLKIAPDSSSDGPLDDEGNLSEEWLELLTTHSDRFFMGADQFFRAPDATPIGPPSAEPTWLLLDELPTDLARAIGSENAVAIYGLDR